MTPPVELRQVPRGALIREIEALTFRLRMAEGKLHAALEADAHCAYCGAPCTGWACHAHSDLSALDPQRQAKRARLTLVTGAQLSRHKGG